MSNTRVDRLFGMMFIWYDVGGKYQFTSLDFITGLAYLSGHQANPVDIGLTLALTTKIK